MGLFDKLLGTTPKATDPQAPAASAGTPTTSTTPTAPVSTATSAPDANTASASTAGLPPLGTPATTSAPTASTTPANAETPNAFQQADSLLGLTAATESTTPTGSTTSPMASPSLTDPLSSATPTPPTDSAAPASPLVPPLAESLGNNDKLTTDPGMSITGSDNPVKIADSPSLDTSSTTSAATASNTEELKKMVADLESKLAELKKAIEK